LGTIDAARLFEHQQFKLGGTGREGRYMQEDGGQSQSKGHVDSPWET